MTPAELAKALRAFEAERIMRSEDAITIFASANLIEAQQKVVDAARKLSAAMADTDVHEANYDLVDKEWTELTASITELNALGIKS